MVFPIDRQLNFTLYGPFPKVEKLVETKTSGRSGVLQPETHFQPFLGGNEQSKTAKTNTSKDNRTVNARSDTATQTPKASGQRDYGQGEIQDLIRKYSAEYGINPETPLCIAKLESGFNPNSKNKGSSAGGVFQYLESTFKATDEGKAGHSRFEAEANIKAAIKYMSSRQSTKPWTVASKCPSIKTIK